MIFPRTKKNGDNYIYFVLDNQISIKQFQGIPCSAFGAVADKIAEMKIEKGMTVSIVGTIRYTTDRKGVGDKNSGYTHHFNVNVENIKMGLWNESSEEVQQPNNDNKRS